MIEGARGRAAGSEALAAAVEQRPAGAQETMCRHERLRDIREGTAYGAFRQTRCTVRRAHLAPASR